MATKPCFPLSTFGCHLSATNITLSGGFQASSLRVLFQIDRNVLDSS